MENTGQPLHTVKNPTYAPSARNWKRAGKEGYGGYNLLSEQAAFAITVDNCRQFKMRNCVTFPCYTSTGQKLVRERETDTCPFQASSSGHYEQGLPTACIYSAFFQGRKIVRVTSRVPTLKIPKNVTKAVLHFSVDPGWQNSTKTCFPEQKISFWLYHLRRLDHSGRGKTPLHLRFEQGAKANASMAQIQQQACSLPLIPWAILNESRLPHFIFLHTTAAIHH